MTTLKAVEIFCLNVDSGVAEGGGSAPVAPAGFMQNVNPVCFTWSHRELHNEFRKCIQRCIIARDCTEHALNERASASEGLRLFVPQGQTLYPGLVPGPHFVPLTPQFRTPHMQLPGAALRVLGINMLCGCRRRSKSCLTS